jgi:glutamine amidotransferase
MLQEESMIAVVDLGIGNISSIGNIIKKTEGDFFICKNPQDLSRAEKIIIPGVGSFDHGVKGLSEGNWINALNDSVLNEKKNVLGICLGMQLMCKHSAEGKLKGLGWIDADVMHFDFNNVEGNLKIPHMGWNTIRLKKSNRLITSSEEEKRFYFVHSYHVVCHDNEDVLTNSHYGYEFASAFNKNNIYGVQFHPEKSHRFGMDLIKNFIAL